MVVGWCWAGVTMGVADSTQIDGDELNTVAAAIFDESRCHFVVVKTETKWRDGIRHEQVLPADHRAEFVTRDQPPAALSRRR